MKRMIIFLNVLVVVVGMSVSANAALMDMHDGTIYDTDTQLSWLKDAGASGVRNWADANTWAVSLNSGSGFAGLTGWRLPTNDICFGFNCANGEMGHLYYTELGNAAGVPLTNTGPFTNLHDGYWSGTEYWPGFPPVLAFTFHFTGFPAGNNGYQWPGDKTDNTAFYAFAVRPGARSQSTPVPASGTLGLIVLGLAGLIIYRKRLLKKEA